MDIQQPTPQTDVNEPAAPPSLTVQDLVTVAQILQLAAQRGTFKMEEFTDVGSLYNKLVTFLQHSGAISPKPQGDEQ
jgi:hypothetical protein